MKKTEEEKKATMVILGTIVILLIIIIVPLAFLNNKSEKNNTKFPGYEYIDITQKKLADKNSYNEIKTSLEGNTLFKSEYIAFISFLSAIGDSDCATIIPFGFKAFLTFV